MEPLELSEFVDICGGTAAAAGDGAPVCIRTVSVHSRRIHADTAFFALRGARGDGHAFVEDALGNGAAVAVVERGRVASRGVDLARIVEVDDPLLSLQALASWWRRRLSATVVAVVGTYGKTATKDALADFLGGQCRVFRSPASLNTELGVALSMLACPVDADVAVIEMASDRPGTLRRQTGVVRPDHVVVTSTAWRPLLHFAEELDQVREILSACEAIPEKGWGLVPTEVAASITAKAVHRVNASSSLPRFERTRSDAGTTDVRVTFPDGHEATVSLTPTTPRAIIDVELALSAAWLLGVPAPTLVSRMVEYTPASSPMQSWRSPGGAVIVRSVATVEPMTAGVAMRTASRLARPGGRKLVVLAAPLVSTSDDGLHALAQTLLAEGADHLVTRADETHGGIEAAFAAARGIDSVRSFAHDEDLRSFLLSALGPGDVALIQSDRQDDLDRLMARIMETMAPTRLYIDLGAVEENVVTFRRLVGPSVRLMGMVKALAYGTDSLPVSMRLQESGADFLGVSSADEGVALRQYGVTLPILVLLGGENELRKVVEHGLIPLVYSREILDAVLVFAQQSDARLSVHVEVDSGMHRTGLAPGEAASALLQLRAAGVAVEGVMTHLACADDPEEDAFTRMQLDRFRSVIERARDAGFDDLVVHAAASAAAIRLPEARFDMVRLGLGIYGVHPAVATKDAIALRPVLALVSRLVEVSSIPAGERVGYGGTWAAPPEGGRIGVVAAGYYDCVPRSFSNHGYVVIEGQRCPIVGTVSMDSMTVDISHVPSARVGTDVLIYGRYGESVVPIDDVARAAGTIPNELMTRIGPRVQRIFT